MNNNICPKCGYSLNSNTNFCPNCGNKIENNNINNNIEMNSSTGKLIISRLSKIYGYAASLTIIINGMQYKLANGSRLEFDLAPGVYSITWRCWCRRDKTIQINVTPNNWYQLEFRPDYFWGGFKLTNNCKFY